MRCSGRQAKPSTRTAPAGFQERECVHVVRILDDQRDGGCLGERADDQLQALSGAALLIAGLATGLVPRRPPARATSPAMAARGLGQAVNRERVSSGRTPSTQARHPNAAVEVRVRTRFQPAHLVSLNRGPGGLDAVVERHVHGEGDDDGERGAAQVEGPVSPALVQRSESRRATRLR
jgi:hypothetical protein